MPPWLNGILLLLFLLLLLPGALYWLMGVACRPGKERGNSDTPPPGTSWCEVCQDYHGPVKDL
jgi:hypothetical protein